MIRHLVLPLLATLALSAAPKEPTPLQPKGTLVIVGGGDEPQDVLDAFFKAAGGKGGVVGVVTTATSDPEGNLKEWQGYLDTAGMTMVPFNVNRREDSTLPAMLEAARRCTGFWFTGGDQNRVGDKIVGTPLQKLILERYVAGAGIGGTSAGAAIMSHIMLTGDDRNGKESLVEFGKGAYKTREGMGFLPEFCIVDQHFLRRNRQNRLFSVMMEHPDHLGLGIDEATALVVKNGKATVVGQRAVMVFDPRGMKLDAAEGFWNMKIHLLRRGQSLDLTTRKLLP